MRRLPHRHGAERRLDGIYGVISGLEILRTLAEGGSGRAPEVEVVIFAEEEGSNFGSTMTGSKCITGVYGENDLTAAFRPIGRRTSRGTFPA